MPTNRIIVAFQKTAGAKTRFAGGHPELKAVAEHQDVLAVYSVVGDAKTKLAELRKDPSVRAAEFDQPVNIHLAPNDSDYPQQWGPSKVNAPLAWNATTGSPGVAVGIIDTGVELSHPEFAGRILPSWNFVGNNDNPNDDNGHGTHVAGILGASGNNGFGIAGMAWDIRILPVKVLSASGGGYLSDLIRGLDYARDKGVKVINMSLGTTADSQLLHEAVDRAAAAGILVVASAGNSGSGTNAPSYPAAYASVLAVGATDQGDRRASYSTYGSYVGIAAPGSLIYSTYKSGGYATLSGTSMAAPHVSGLAALIWSKQSNLSAAQVRQTIEQSAVVIGSSARSDEYGAGRIDATRWASSLGTVDSSPTPSPTPTTPPPSTTPSPPSLQPKPQAYSLFISGVQKQRLSY